MPFDESVVARRSVVLSLALVLPFLACLTVATLGRPLPDASSAVGLVLLIVAAAATGWRVAGLGAALSAALWFDYFLTEPYDSFTIGSSEDLQVAVLLLFVGLAVTELALWGQRQRTALGRERGYLDGVLAIAGLAAFGPEGGEEVVRSASRQLTSLLGLDTCEFRAGDGIETTALTMHRDGTVTLAGVSSDLARDGFPTDRAVNLPVRCGARTHGWFELVAASHVARPTLEQRRVAGLLADQVANALSL